MAIGYANIIEQIADPDVPLAQFRRLLKLKPAAGDTSLRFVAEGVSWFHYPIVLRDTLDWLNDSYAIFDLAAAGDTLQNMKRGISNIAGYQILLTSSSGKGLKVFCSAAEGTTCWKVTD